MTFLFVHPSTSSSVNWPVIYAPFLNQVNTPNGENNKDNVPEKSFTFHPLNPGTEKCSLKMWTIVQCRQFERDSVAR